jgi:hypothetical protein
MGQTLSALYRVASYYVALVVLLPRQYSHRLRTLALTLFSPSSQIRRILARPSAGAAPRPSSSPSSPWHRPADVDETVWRVERYVADSRRLVTEHARLSLTPTPLSSSEGDAEEEEPPTRPTSARRLDDDALHQVSRSVGEKHNIDKQEPVSSENCDAASGMDPSVISSSRFLLH